MVGGAPPIFLELASTRVEIILNLTGVVNGVAALILSVVANVRVGRLRAEGTRAAK